MHENPGENGKTAERASQSSIHELLGQPFDIASVKSRSEAEQAAFELYREATIVVTVASHLYEANGPSKFALNRNQAICVGLLIRIAKFMNVVLQLASTHSRGDVVLALNRCLTESALNLEFLVTTDSAKNYDEFVLFSLGPERELYDTIQENIQDRNGEVWPIEQRMLNSIERTCRVSGVRIDDVKVRNPDWGKNFRERLKQIGKEDWYLHVQRVASHAIHGSWVDLVLHHIDFDGSTELFAPDASWSAVDARLLTPIATIILVAARDYIEKHFGKHQDIGAVMQRIDDLGSRIKKLDQMHEELMTNKPAPDPA
jgi:hypothetical protein